jgi:predicted TIM-barrel fold metal-dependent hydrolase
MSDATLHDAAQYIIESPDLWTSRLPQQYADRAPRVVVLDGGGEAWAFEGGAWTRPLGLVAGAGHGPLEVVEEGYTYAQLREGMHDARERLADMDLDGVSRACIFPTFGLEVRGIADPELHRLCVRAYNDAVWDWSRAGDGRLVPQALIPASGLDDALAELEHVIDLGYRGIVFPGWPAGGDKPQAEEDRFWARCAEAGVVVALVRGGQTGDRRPVAPARYSASNGVAVRVADPSIELRLTAEATTKNGPMSWLILDGVLDRFPDLRLVLVGAGVGWLRSCGELLDWNYRYAQFIAFAQLRELPSEYIRRQVSATVDREPVVPETVEDLGAQGLLWASPYPTSMSTWPESRGGGAPQPEAPLPLVLPNLKTRWAFPASIAWRSAASTPEKVALIVFQL